MTSEKKQLKRQHMEYERNIEYLENRVDDLEQNERCNHFWTGNLTTELPASCERHRVGEQRGTWCVYGGAGNSISSWQKHWHWKQQYWGMPPSTSYCKEYKRQATIPAVIVRFTNRKHKVNLLRQGRKLKGTNLYINERLAKKQAYIASKVRQLKKQGKNQTTWTVNCKVFIKTKWCIWAVCIRRLGCLERFDKNCTFVVLSGINCHFCMHCTIYTTIPDSWQKLNRT